MPNGDDTLPPTALRRAFELLVQTLNERKIRYAIIGGIAIMHHTRARITDDIDALVLVPQIAMPALFEALAERGFKVDLRRNITELRDHGLTSLEFEDVLIDLMQPQLPIHAHVLDKTVDGKVGDQRVRMLSAEGLIIMKALSMRPQDETDIHDLLTAYPGKLDLNCVRRELDTVLRHDDPKRTRLESLIGKPANDA